MNDVLESGPVRKTAFNAFVQKVQEEAMAFGIETRMRPSYNDDGRIIAADFEAYWDGKWLVLASEKPFIGEDNSGWVRPEEWLKIAYQAAGELARS